MTTPYRPTIRTQAELETPGATSSGRWASTGAVSGSCSSTRDDRPTPVMTEVTDLPDAPDAEATDGFGHCSATCSSTSTRRAAGPFS